MSSTATPALSTLRERQADLTRRLIVDSAIRLLVEDDEHELSVRAVAAAGRMSERTVFRYFESRDALMDAVAAELNARQALPPLPKTEEELLDYPRAIFTSFEANQALTRAALRGEIHERIRSSDRTLRGRRLRELVDAIAPDADANLRRLVASNIHYHVTATTWDHYRVRFGFSQDDTIAAARLAVEQAIAALRGS